MADLCGWKIRFKVILIDWESFDDILMHFNDQIREKTWWVNARKMLIRKDSTENHSVCIGSLCVSGPSGSGVLMFWGPSVPRVPLI